MQTTIKSDHAIPCAQPDCGALTTLAEAVYVDACGHVCLGCEGPLPGWFDEIEPPW